MKKLFTFIALAGSAAWLSAQITVTNAAFPALGDTLKLAVDNSPAGIVITPPGSNYQWDFTGLDADLEQEIKYRAASEGSAGASLPGAELFAELGGGTEGYYNVTANAFEWMAFLGPDPVGLNVSTLFKFTPPIVERRAPMTFPSNNTSSSSLLIPFAISDIPGIAVILDSLNLPVTPDSLRLRVTSSRNDFVDAWGTLAIPGGAFPVLREKRTELRETRIDVKVPVFGWQDVTDILITNPNLSNLGKDTVVTYNFFSNEAKEPIAVVTMDAQEQSAVQAMFKNIDQPSGAEDVKNSKPAVSVSPNPVTGMAKFELKNFLPGNYSLQIIGPTGAVVLEKIISQTKQVDLSRLSAGNYFFRVADAGGRILAAGLLQKR